VGIIRPRVQVLRVTSVVVNRKMSLTGRAAPIPDHGLAFLFGTAAPDALLDAVDAVAGE
jgi:hypothetical protein